MKSIVDYRGEIREAFWLWWRLSTCTVASAEKWWKVHDGTLDGAYADAGLAAGLDVPEATARRWRLRLEKAGLIRTFPVARRRRRFEVLNLGFIEGTLDAGSSAQPSELSLRLN